MSSSPEPLVGTSPAMKKNFLIAQRAVLTVVAVGFVTAFVGNVVMNVRGGSPVTGMAIRSFGLTVTSLGLMAFLISSVWQRAEAKASKKRIRTMPRKRPTAQVALQPLPPSAIAARILAVALFALAGLSLVVFLVRIFAFPVGIIPRAGLTLIGAIVEPATLCALGLTLWLVGDMVQYVASIADLRTKDGAPVNETVMATLVKFDTNTAEDRSVIPPSTEKEA